MATSSDNGSAQRLFHERWGELNDPHVRALAWLLDAPDLLAPAAPQWQGKIGSIKIDSDRIRNWLSELDSRPGELHAWLNLPAVSRLGRYAERLMAFYFTHEGKLIAHGVQLRGANQQTVGEFDFLLDHENSVLHIELATKFYLLETGSRASSRPPAMDYFIGPNLADTLGLKMRKIIDRQLALGQHDAARAQLPRQVDMAKALVKGWLFYHARETIDADALGLSNNHCRGFWCTSSELAQRPEQHFVILPRLSWLPPVKSKLDQVLSKDQLLSAIARHFEHETMPVLVSIVETDQEFAFEAERGFIVPDDWQARAGQQHVQK
jgi:uncharacterized protein